MRYVILLAGLAACQQRENPPRMDPAPPPPAAVPERPAARPPERPSAPPTPAPATAAVSIATFVGENVTECVTINVTLAQGPSDFGMPRLTPDQAATMLTDEFFVTAHGGDSLLKRSGTKQITEFMDLDNLARKLAGASSDGKGKPITAAKRAEGMKKLQEMIASFSWPPKSIATDLKRGTVAKVDSCEIPNHIALATCSLKDSAPTVSWSVVQRHFSVAATVDSDRAFKQCLSIAGRWSSADSAAPEIAEERLRQHARKLQGQLTDIQGKMRELAQ